MYIELKYDKIKEMWIMDRKSSPRRMPLFEMQFKSLYHAWAYYMNGYLGWESVAAQKNCYFGTRYPKESENCLGGSNNIPSNRRNMILVRQEDYAYDPQKVLAEIFSFATRGAFDATKDKHLFVLSDKVSKGLNHTEEMDVSFNGIDVPILFCMYNSVRIYSLTFNFVRKKCRVVILQKVI
jgi:hypothetical protein